MRSKHIHTRLSEAGYKLTTSRKEIVSWIAKNKGVFSASEILLSLKHLDKVSVYRTLELFSKLDIIHAVQTLHGEQHYELHDAKKHHHHIVCTKCEKNECVPCDIPEKTFSSFTHIHHSVLFTGVCKPCGS